MDPKIISKTLFLCSELVGFDPASVEDLTKPPPKLPKREIAVDPLVTDDFCPLINDHFIDFDSIDDWIVENDPIEGENPCQLEGSEANMSVEFGDPIKETAGGNSLVEAAVPGELENFGSQIEEGMEKVSLVGTTQGSVQISIKSENMEDFNEKKSDGYVAAVLQSVKTEVVNGEMEVKVSSDTNLEKPDENNGGSDSKSCELIDGDDYDSSSESESEVSSTSSSSSSCSEEEEEDDDERDMRDVGDMEEGEIRDFEGDGIAGDSDDEEEVVMKGPIKSKNEIQILPPVPPVDVALEPHHQTLPVGDISSIMGTNVIVEGLENHNPLNEGSILWITETRSLLGLVDEVFGPVKNPYYVVRYNSDKEVPAGIHKGTPVSFVEDFANHVLNEKNLYNKGYDASGENDEEVCDEFEFSDDEKEAEYRRMQKTAKRGADDHKRGNRDFIDRKKAGADDHKRGNRNFNDKKAHQKGGFQKKIHPPVPPGPQPTPHAGQPPGIANQRHTPSVAAPVGCDGFACSCSTGPGTSSMSTFPPSGSQVEQATYCMPQHSFTLNNGVWTNGLPSQQQQQQQHAVFPTGSPFNGVPSQLQNVPLPFGQSFQHLNPLFVNFSNGMPVQQQFNPSQMLRQSVALPCGRPNFTARPLSTPWTGIVGHTGFNHPTFGMEFDGRLGQSSMNSGEQGVLSGGSCNELCCGMQQSAVSQRSFATPQQFHQGAFSTHGRKPYRRGDGNFAGGRGRRRSG
ncbi:hypothetical protein NE237_006064 [Protea cynaroides]|uniref:H/ACA ribonucleoprotein complex non-core subunit NAF1 n=1 Tax=Protea cynaroides TaxID=273540 RepID=A0A9Q0KLY8_9MAGN|nr:hypothetical protein NE237_006064 [Protea cynaroides]